MQSNTGNVYIKCQIDQCPIFMHEDSAYYYMKKYTKAISNERGS